MQPFTIRSAPLVAVSARNELEFAFDNLPILTDLGFDAAPVDGIATIRFNEDGEWHVGDISLNGSKLIRPITHGIVCFERKPVPLCPDAHKWLFLAILDRLENGPFNATITDRVVQELDDMGISARVSA